MVDRHVIAIAPAEGRGGAELALCRIAEAMPDFGWSCSIVCLNEGPLVAMADAKGVQRDVVLAGRLRRPDSTALALAKLRRVCREKKPNAIIGNMDKGQIYAGSIGRLLGVESLWWQHMIPTRSTFFNVAARTRPAAVIAGSTVAVASQRALTPELRVELIPPGVPVNDWTARRGSGLRVRESWGVRESSLVLGVAGRLSPEKGHEDLLEVAALLRHRIPELRIVFVGSGDDSYVAYLMHRARLLSVDDLLTFSGHRDDPLPFMDALDIVVVPSWREPFGMVTVEALALGKPVVATAAGGSLDILAASPLHRLVPPREPHAMHEAILSVTHELATLTPHTLSNLEHYAIDRAREFSVEKTTRAVVALLDDVATSHIRSKD